MDYTVNDQTINADEEGYITDISTWSIDLAGTIAETEILIWVMITGKW